MMANRRAAFAQSDLTKVLKAYKDAGFGAPTLIIEPQRITATPALDKPPGDDPNPWDRP